MTGNEEKEESSTFPVVAPAEVSDSIILGRGGKGKRVQHQLSAEAGERV